MASLKKTIRLYRSLPLGPTPRVAHTRLVAALESEMKRHQGHPVARRRRPS
jgi:hypothetical protein